MRDYQSSQVGKPVRAHSAIQPVSMNPTLSMDLLKTKTNLVLKMKNFLHPDDQSKSSHNEFLGETQEKSKQAQIQPTGLKLNNLSNLDQLMVPCTYTRTQPRNRDLNPQLSKDASQQ